MVAGLLLIYTGAFTRPVVAKESSKQADPYVKEIIRQKNGVTVAGAFVDAVKKNNAIVLSRVALRQRLDKDGRLEGCELVQVDKGSSVAKMGFRSGDRLTSVNGIPVRELETKRAELEASSRWELVVLRQGKLRKIVIQVRE
jgi:predicted metalloprotease with PDZ domain